MAKRNKYIKAAEPIGGYVESTSFVQGSNTTVTVGATGVVSTGSSQKPNKPAITLDADELKRLVLCGPRVSGNTVNTTTNTVSSSSNSVSSPANNVSGPAYIPPFPTVAFTYGRSGFDGLNFTPLNKKTQSTLQSTLSIYQDLSVNAADAGEVS